MNALLLALFVLTRALVMIMSTANRTARFYRLRVVGIVAPLAVLFFLAPGVSEANDETRPLRLIPLPQEVKLVEGTFKLSPQTRIGLAESGNTDDAFAATQLLEEVKQDLDLELQLQPAALSGPGTIVLGQIGRDKLIDQFLAEHGLKPAKDLGEQGYILAVLPDRIVIASPGAAGLFYGVQTLKQLIRSNPGNREIPCCYIVDWPVLKYRGWHDDISRGPIPTMDFLKRQIRTFSEYKLNQFTFYNSHVFKLKKYPTVAPPDGITGEQVKELSAYAKKYHVDLIGNFQTVKCAGNYNKVAPGINVGSPGSQIAVGNEQSYQFLADVFSEIVPAFESQFFHINADEYVGIGWGPQGRQMLQKLGPGGLYAYFINRVCRLLEPYGKTPMFWADIPLRDPDICIPELPTNAIAMSWDYGARASFKDSILPFTEHGLSVYVCPSVYNFGVPWPRIRYSSINISNFVRDGAIYGALGMLNTSWDDRGEEFFSYTWYGFVWSAECAWQPVVPKLGQDPDAERDKRQTDFKNSFDSVFYGLAGNKAASAFLAMDDVFTHEIEYRLNPNRFFAFPTTGLPQDRVAQAEKTLKKINKVIKDLETLRSTASRNADSFDFAVYAARTLRFIVERSIVVSQSRSSRRLARNLARLRKEIESLRSEFIRLWYLESRPSSIERPLGRFDELRKSFPSQ